MPNFANCCFYKIISKDVNITELFVDYTTDYEKTSKCYREKFETKNFYEFIRENGDWNNFEIIKIEDFPCSSARDASKRKRYWIKELNAEINKMYLKYYCHYNIKPEIRETCICGSNIRIEYKSRHLKTKIHKDYLRHIELFGE